MAAGHPAHRQRAAALSPDRRDRRAVRHPGAPGSTAVRGKKVVVVGGGIAGLSAAASLADRGVAVTLLEAHPQLGGRVRAWPVGDPGEQGDPAEPRTMSRGFHAFFRQYYNLRSLLDRAGALEHLMPLTDYPLVSADGMRDSFAGVPRTPPLNMLAFVLRSPSFTLRDLRRVDVRAALELLDVRFPETFSAYDGESAAAFLDRLAFPPAARHLALEVFARSFFAHPDEFSAGELVGMFHTYFVGSSEGLLFDVPDDDYDTALWAPLRRHLTGLGVDVRTGTGATAVRSTSRGVEVDAGSTLTADAVVLATDPATTRRLTADLGDQAWRAQVRQGANAPSFAVWRLWLDRPAAPERPPFLGTSGFRYLDNVSVLERYEAGAARWARTHGGSVVELHAYALPAGADEATVRDVLRAELAQVYPELAAAQVRAQEWLVDADCPLLGAGVWAERPGVRTPDPRVVLAGDGVRCDLPVALMERAATTGVLAADELLTGWGGAGHDLWTVPMRSRHPVAGSVRRLLARTGPLAPMQAAFSARRRAA